MGNQRRRETNRKRRRVKLFWAHPTALGVHLSGTNQLSMYTSHKVLEGNAAVQNEKQLNRSLERMGVGAIVVT